VFHDLLLLTREDEEDYEEDEGAEDGDADSDPESDADDTDVDGADVDGGNEIDGAEISGEADNAPDDMDVVPETPVAETDVPTNNATEEASASLAPSAGQSHQCLYVSIL
jgi:hypothetical protein